jgi:transposase
MKGRIRYTEEFKRDAVSQVKDRGYTVSEVANRLGICTNSLYKWIRKYNKPVASRKEEVRQAEEIHRLKAELARVIEERDVFRSGDVSCS